MCALGVREAAVVAVFMMLCVGASGAPTESKSGLRAAAHKPDQQPSLPTVGHAFMAHDGSVKSPRLETSTAQRSGSRGLRSMRGGAQSGSGDIQEAVGAVLGCGDGISPEHLRSIEQAMLPMWQTLPKNKHDRIERRSLRYMAHRYFMHKQNLAIRGFEPSHSVDASHSGAADILSQRVPAYVETVLEGKQQVLGFTLDDAVKMVATLEQLIFDNESALLESVYRHLKVDPHQSYKHLHLSDILEVYMVHWMGDNSEDIEMLLANRTLLEEAVPHWNDIAAFAAGQVRSSEFTWQGSPRPRHGRDMLVQEYSFDDAHEVVGSITKSFGHYWESECKSMKEQLVDMDKGATGRVRLSDFYAAGLGSSGQFAESEAYLRQLGALDETSTWNGQQVIISNYLQAASNCIVSTPYYLVCCENECESLLGEIEAGINAPVAAPNQILQLVGNMSSPSSEDGEMLKLQGTLVEQLEHVASAHGGKVPIHGRLFAQWLHYVFPRECPFPHKQGAASMTTPSEFGEEFIATDQEMEDHVSAGRKQADNREISDSNEWMSQWSSEEELLADYAVHLHAPWEVPHYGLLVGALLLASAAAWVLLGGAGHASAVVGLDGRKVMKSHLV